MAAKPIYEELERRVKELEKEAGKRKKEDRVLYQSKKTYQNILSSIEDGYYEVDLAGNLTFFNDSLCKIYGYARDELMGMNNRNYMTAETAKKTYEVFNRVYKTGEPTKIFDWEFIKKDGTKVDVEISVSLIRNPKGQAIGFRGIVRDIRERKLTEKSLRESEENFRTLAMNANDGILIAVGDGCHTYANRHAAEITGYSVSELIKTNIKDLAHPNEFKKIKERYRTIIAGKSVKRKYETIIVSKDKEEIPVEVTSAKSKWHGQPADIVIIRDIRELKRAQEELVKSRAMFKAIVESLPFDVFVLDQDKRYILQNATCKKNWGDLIGKSPEDLPVIKETSNLWKENNRRALSGEIVTGEVAYDTLDGGKNFYYNIIAPICDGNKILGIVGVLVDISSRKYAEEALRESELKLSTMLESIGDHMSMMDKDLNIIWANEIARKIFGNIIIGKKCYEVYHKRTEPCEPYPCIALRAFQDGKIHEHDTQVIDKDGKTVFFHCTANVALKDEEGKPTAVLEISRDITENVRAENALQKAKDELENRVEERTRELEIQKSNLEEANIALQVLLKKRQEDKKEIADNVLTNVKELVTPYFEKIRKTKLDDQQKVILSIIGYNLNEIVSPFTRKMSQKYLNLTPTEIEVTNLIRYGSDSKEISELMGLSPRTIYNHRKNIRKKFGIENKKTNLRSHLLSIY